jgi:hypothetical protein
MRRKKGDIIFSYPRSVKMDVPFFCPVAAGEAGTEKSWFQKARHDPWPVNRRLQVVRSDTSEG